MIRAQLALERHPRIHIGVFAFLMMLQTGIVFCQSPKGKKPESSPSDRSGTPQSILLRCPDAGLQAVQPAPGKTAHHSVTLKWNGSAASARPESQAVGYCLYRSRKADAAKKKPACDDCERVNPVPISGTGCIDDDVQGGVTYYYVVAAINAKGTISPASNQIAAVIPEDKEDAQSPSVSYPLCRSK